MKLPPGLKFQTFQEERNARAALLDAATLSNWTPVRGEVAAVHKLSGQPIQIKLRPDLGHPFWKERGLATSDDLLALLRSLDRDAALALNVLVGAVRECRDVRICEADLVKALGWGSRSAEDTKANEEAAGLLLMVICSLRIHGERRGTWKDAQTREPISTKQDGNSLILVESDPHHPGKLIVSAGQWLIRHLDNGQLLEDFGSVQSLLDIPARQKSGAMARRLGMALLQMWRESARYAKEGKGSVSIGKPLTRMELLSRAGILEEFVSIVKGHDPGRALKLWADTLGHLHKRASIILPPLAEVVAPFRRKAWSDFWLYARVELKPSGVLARAALDIAEGAHSARRRHFGQKAKGGARRAA